MKLGVQLQPWFLDDPELDLDEILGQVRQAGFCGIEIYAQIFEWARPQDLIELTESRSMQIAGVHIGADIYNPQAVSYYRDILPVIAALARQVGAGTLHYSGLMIENKPHAELEAELKAIQIAANHCADMGVEFCYHNHWWEIANACRELRYFRDRTDPKLVSFSLDLGWVYRAGCDPIKAIDMLGERIKSVYLRDVTPEKEWCSLGSGTINLIAILRKLDKLQPNWIVVDPADIDGRPYACIAEAREYLAVFAGW